MEPGVSAQAPGDGPPPAAARLALDRRVEPQQLPAVAPSQPTPPDGRPPPEERLAEPALAPAEIPPQELPPCPVDLGRVLPPVAAPRLDPGPPKLPPPAATPEPAPRGEPGPGDETPPAIRAMPPVAYPASCRRAGHAGRVVIRVSLSAEGVPFEATVEQSSGCAELDAAALDAARAASYRPATASGRTVPSALAIPFDFSIE